MLELSCIDLSRAVVAGAQFINAHAVDVKAGHGHAGTRKGDRHRKADIAQTDDRDFTTVGHAGAFCTNTAILVSIGPARTVRRPEFTLPQMPRRAQ